MKLIYTQKLKFRFDFFSRLEAEKSYHSAFDDKNFWVKFKVQICVCHEVVLTLPLLSLHVPFVRCK